MPNFNVFQKEFYTVEKPSLVLGEKQPYKRVILPTTAIIEGLNKAIDDEIKDVVLLNQGRSACFKVVADKGDKFVKVFYSKKSPVKIYSLITKAYEDAGKDFHLNVIKIAKRVYLSVSPFVCGQPLIKIYGKISKEEQIRAGREIGDMLCALHGVTDYSKYGVYKYSPKKLLRKEYFSLKLAKEKDQSVWRLYNFVKANLKLLKTPVFLCHGDMHANNVMCDIERGEYTLIDFDAITLASEYIDYAPLSFLPNSLSPFVKTTIETCFNGQIPSEFWVKNMVAVALYALVYRRFNKDFTKTAVELLDAKDYIPFWGI